MLGHLNAKDSWFWLPWDWDSIGDIHSGKDATRLRFREAGDGLIDETNLTQHREVSTTLRNATRMDVSQR